MAVYLRGNKWYYKFTVRGKTFHYSVPEATCKKEAQDAEAVVKSEILRGKYSLAENKGEMTFSKLADSYMEYSKTNNRSWKSDRSKMKYLLDYFGRFRLRDITSFDVEKYRSMRKKMFTVRGTPVKNNTINRDIEMLRKMLNIAIENKWMNNDNPASSKRVKKLRGEETRERYLTQDEEICLLAACIDDRAYLKPIIICALNTGMRKGEILNLNWKKVDMKNGVITVTKTKSGKERKIPISSALRPIIESLYKNKNSEHVFGNHETQKPFYDLKRGFPAVRKLASIEDFTFHDLRHTAATRMVAAGIDLVVVKEILGHASIETTMRYAHPLPERKLKAVEALANYKEEDNVLTFNR